MHTYSCLPEPILPVQDVMDDFKLAFIFIIIIIILHNWRMKYIWSVFLEPRLDVTKTAYICCFNFLYSINFCYHLRSLFRFLSWKLISKYNIVGVIWISSMSLSNSWFGSVSLLSPVSHKFWESQYSVYILHSLFLHYIKCEYVINIMINYICYIYSYLERKKTIFQRKIKMVRI